jgi:hypothetical protein
LTLPRVAVIREIKVYNRAAQPQRIDGVTVWVGVGMTGGNYDGALKVGTIQYEEGKNPFVFSDLTASGSNVQIQGGSEVLQLAEVEVYETGNFYDVFV